MKRTKKLLVGLLVGLGVLFGSFGLAACDETESSSSSNGSSVEQGSQLHSSSEEESGSQDGGNTNDKETGVFSRELKYTLLSNDTYEVSGIGDCTDTEIVLPATYKGKEVTGIGDYAFSNCESLTSIDIPDSVTSIGNGAFSDCTALTEIHYNATECADLSYGNKVFSYAGQSGAGITVTIGANVKNIPAYLFDPHSSDIRHAPKITKVIFEEGSVCESIGDDAFRACDSLTGVVIGDSVETIGYGAFSDCDGLTSIVIPDSVTSISSHAFYDCNSLTSVVIGDSVDTIGVYAFASCYKLVEVVNKSPDITITKRDYYGNGCVGWYALAVYNSEDTYETKISNDNGYIIYIDGEEKILVGYVGTETVLVLPAYITKIYQYALYYCDGLTKVDISDSVITIGERAFYNCNSLTSVVIGDSVTSIGDSAFAFCESLKSITFNGTVEEWNAIHKGDSWKFEISAKKVLCSDGEVTL